MRYFILKVRYLFLKVRYFILKVRYLFLKVRYRAHSFPRAAEFRGIWVFAAEFTAEFVFLPRNTAEFDVFHSNNYFFTENDLKVALSQVCFGDFLFDGDGWMMKMMINEWIMKDS